MRELRKDFPKGSVREACAVSAEAALHLYDFHYRPLVNGTTFQQAHKLWKQWLDTADGEAYQLLIDTSADPWVTRAYIRRYAS